MICDTYGNSKLYGAPGSRLERALAWLVAGKAEGLAVGRHEIEGSDIFLLVQEYDSKPIDACKWEAHRKYIDVQCVASGVEYIDWAPLGACRVLEYDSEKDFQDLATDELTAVTMKPGRFLVLFPADAHRPCRAFKTPAPVRKLVLKIRVE
jgi:YhcH/YjgK/YiaL family protein